MRRSLAGVLGLVAVFALVRGPLHAVTFALPVSNDDAILLLMARHVLRGELSTILWNQPYNGALDAYLLAPGLAVASHHTAFRLYELVCAALLVLLAFHLGRRLGGEGAAWAAALLAAWGTPYMALMTATGPPPNFLMPLLTGLPLAAAMREGDSPRAPLLAAGLGLVCGLAVWNSSLAIPALVGIGMGLLAAGVRPRRPLVVASALLGGFALGVGPLLAAWAIGASGSEVVTAASAVTAVRPRWLWGKGLDDLAHAVSGLVGLEVPLVADGPERAALPTLLRLCLGGALPLAVAIGCVSRRALPFVGWAGALAAAFALSRRTGPDELRYLYGLVVPAVVLAGAGLARVWAWRRAAGVALGLMIAVPWAVGDRAVAAAWRDPNHAVRVWQVPPVEPALEALRRADVRSAYASLQFAGRLTLESGGDVIASQAWNERIPGDPLRFRDEVDLDPQVAWVLSGRLSRGMPRAGGFRRLLEGMGGLWQEDAAGDLVVFRDFRPPYDESRPVPAAAVSVTTLDGVALPAQVEDRDGATGWKAAAGIARGGGLVARVDPPRALSALVVQLGLERWPAVPWVAEVDGRTAAEGPGWKRPSGGKDYLQLWNSRAS